MRWNSSLDKFLWRVDIKSVSKLQPDIDEPIAYINLKSSNKKSIEFEMNKSQVNDILVTLSTIEKKFSEFS